MLFYVQAAANDTLGATLCELGISITNAICHLADGSHVYYLLTAEIIWIILSHGITPLCLHNKMNV